MEDWILFSDQMPQENAPILYEDDNLNSYEGYLNSGAMYIATQSTDQEFVGNAVRWRLL